MDLMCYGPGEPRRTEEKTDLLAGVEAGRRSARKTTVIGVDDEVLERHRVLRANQNDECARAFSLIRTQLLQKLEALGLNSLAVLSPASGEGKTLTAINLGISIARSAQHTALVVDLDLRSPGIHECFELQPERGVTDVLAGATGIGPALINPGIEDFNLLPAGAGAARPAEMLASRRAAAFARELSERYPDRVQIYDLPGVLTHDDALAFMPNVEAYVLVVQEGRTRRDSIERMLKLLDGKPMLGSIINRSTERLSA